MSRLIQIADAVVAELNASGSPLAPVGAEPLAVAQRLYVPRFSLEEMSALHVTVVPKGVTVQRADRSSRQFDYAVDVAVQKQTTDPAVMDGLMALVESVGEFFEGKRLAGIAFQVGVENEPAFSPEHAEQQHLFTSVLTLAFRVID